MAPSLSKHIMVGMSGGVDSSVTALLLKKAGHRVEGVFMKNWEEDDTETDCPASQDMADAQAVCDQLNIPLHRINFSSEYWERVFVNFLSEYSAYRTPNPDILCNKEIKFRAFLDYAKLKGADCIATGHYARIFKNKDHFELQKGLDHNKDQSYFLYTLTEAQLAQSLFPIGDLTKNTVRQIAKEAGFPNHAKKDSTGICFIGERKFKTFLNNYLKKNPGPIETPEGQCIGTHDGLIFYTLGQRQGLKIGGQKEMREAPWYVVRKDIEKNALIVAQGHDHPLLFSQTLFAENIHWINSPPLEPYLHAKIRYRQKDQACKIHPNSQNQVKIEFAEPQRAVTPGQSIVFYKDQVCLGGGIIGG